MSKLQHIARRLREIEALEGKESLDQLGSYIVGLLIVDEKGSNLSDSNAILSRIADLASDLEASNEASAWREEVWQEIKELIMKVK